MQAKKDGSRERERERERGQPKKCEELGAGERAKDRGVAGTQVMKGKPLYCMLLTGERRGMDFLGRPFVRPPLESVSALSSGPNEKKNLHGRMQQPATSGREGGRGRLSEARLRHIRPPFSRARHPYPLSLSQLSFPCPPPLAQARSGAAQSAREKRRMGRRH